MSNQSNQEMSNQEALKDFNFVTQRGTINWRSVSKLNIPKIKQNKDIVALQTELPNAIYPLITEEGLITARNVSLSLRFCFRHRA